MAATETILTETHNSVTTVTLNRPEVRNALNSKMMAEITSAFAALGDDNNVRIIVLAGAGASFSAGADIKFMQESGRQSIEQNADDARMMETMFRTINECPKPVIGKIHGHAFGGGFGLCTVCDIVVADQSTVFSLSEVLIGIIPSVIGTFTKDKIGLSHFRALGISGEKFDGSWAEKIGLVHFSVKTEELNETVEAVVNQLKKAGPQAMAKFKEYIRNMDSTEATNVIAELRASEEGQEGLSAFLEKRLPNWVEN